MSVKSSGLITSFSFCCGGLGVRRAYAAEPARRHTPWSVGISVHPHQDRLTEADPDARGGDADPTAASLQLAAQVDDHAGRRGPERVADGDRPAVDVHPV